MPILTSSKKALRRDKRRTAVNSKIRAQVRAAVKRAREGQTAATINQAYSALDKAAKKGVIHPNKAARLKSRLVRLAKTKKTSKQTTGKLGKKTGKTKTTSTAKRRPR